MNKFVAVQLTAALFLLAATASARAKERPPLKVVPSLDLSRYAGKWYEIARLPNSFQKKCAGEVTADYAPRPDGRVTVVNRCRKADGTDTEAKGTARVADKKGPNSVLKVRFAPSFLSFLPFVWGDYQEVAGEEERAHVLNGLLASFPRLTPVESVISQGSDTPRVIVYRIRVNGITGVVER